MRTREGGQGGRAREGFREEGQGEGSWREGQGNGPERTVIIAVTLHPLWGSRVSSKQKLRVF